MKMSTAFLKELEKAVLQFTRNEQRPRIANATMGSKNKTGGSTIPGFKSHCKVIVIKTAWYLKKKNRLKDLCNPIGNTKTTPSIFQHVIFDKRAKFLHWRKDNLINNVTMETSYPHARG